MTGACDRERPAKREINMDFCRFNASDLAWETSNGLHTTYVLAKKLNLAASFAPSLVWRKRYTVRLGLQKGTQDLFPRTGGIQQERAAGLVPTVRARPPSAAQGAVVEIGEICWETARMCTKLTSGSWKACWANTQTSSKVGRTGNDTEEYP